MSSNANSLLSPLLLSLVVYVILFGKLLIGSLATSYDPYQRLLLALIANANKQAKCHRVFNLFFVSHASATVLITCLEHTKYCK